MGSSQAPNGNLPNSRPPTSPPTMASISKEKKISTSQPKAENKEFKFSYVNLSRDYRFKTIYVKTEQVREQAVRYQTSSKNVRVKKQGKLQ